MSAMSSQPRHGSRHGPRSTPRAPLPVTAVELVDRARASLVQAHHTGDAGQRYIEAHLAALRAAAALLAARSAPSRSSRPRSVWEVLPKLAPELTEWAAFFGASATVRAALERGARGVTSREADDLMRQAEAFAELVQDELGMPPLPPPAYLTPVAVRGTDGYRSMPAESIGRAYR